MTKKKFVDLSKLATAEKHMIEEILAMSKRKVDKLMVPVNEIVAFSQDTTLNRAIEVYTQCHFSRYPVYLGNIDRIVGLLFVKEVISFWNDYRNYPVIEFVRLPHYVYENRSALDVFLELQRLRISLGVVIDEFGGVSGIVTIEDLIEEIVGDIEDEFDARKKPFVERLSDNDYIVNARMEIDDFSEYFGLPIDEDKVSTIGGFIMKNADRIPKVGEEIEYKNLKFTILEGTRRRISKVRVSKKK